jgi:ABC-type branched-subunit amino acid transport system ATPase component/ABC-type branched-subunit amino acid transport system permease subunit
LGTFGNSTVTGRVARSIYAVSARRAHAWIPYVAWAAAFAILPMALPGQVSVLLDPLMIGIAGAIGLNVLMGTAGRISLGQPAFFAGGAYAGAALANTAGQPFLVALLGAVAAGVAVGAVVGLTTYRLTGIYSMISTLALLFVAMYFSDTYTNAVVGIELPIAQIGPIQLLSGLQWYVFLAIIACGFLFAYRRLLASHVGRGLEVIGDRERVAGMLGINVGTYQLYIWMLSGGAVALVGCIQAYYLTAIGSSDIALLVAIQYFAMVIVGGRGSPGGSVIGAVVFITLPFELQQYGTSLGSFGQASNLSDFETILYGVLIIVFLVIAPAGLAGLFASAYAAGSRKVKQLVQRTHDGAAVAQPSSPPLSRPLREPRPREDARAPASEPRTTARSAVSPDIPRILEVRNLTVGYRGGSIALSDVDLEVAPGEIVAVLGPNGAGKTTLLRAIAGFAANEPGVIKNGTIRFKGEPLGRSTFRRARSGVVLIPERDKVFPGLTVEENLELAARSERAARHLADEAIALFPALASRRQLAAGLLSGGERQMLAIARGFMLKPELLLLDETTLGLAPLIAKGVMQHIATAARERQTTIIVVEQNAVLAETACDRFVLLQHGKVESTGEFVGAGRTRFAAAYFGVPSE